MTDERMTPTNVDDHADRTAIKDAEQRLGIVDMDYNRIGDINYYVRRSPSVMLWSVYRQQGNAPVGYVAATYSPTRAMDLEVWDSTGQPFAYGPPDRRVLLNRGLARLHDYLTVTGQ